MNKNYIGVVVKDNNGNLSYQREQISRDYEDLKARLSIMCNNSNRTLLDLQEEFSRIFDSYRYYGYCLPFDYCDSWVVGVRTPHKLTYSEYENQIYKKQRELDRELQFEKMLENNIVYTKEQYIKREIEEYKKKLKQEYYDVCSRYIDAYNFNKTTELIKGRESSVMYSTEDIGWTPHVYSVNDDVKITIDTNFGYGSVSYFFLSMKYKGINILPYTAYINYYNANVVEIMRYTRQYSTRDRDSWNLALKFVVDTANLAKDNADEFINKWIINEVKEMYEGLENFMRNPDTQLQRFIDQKRQSINGFCYMAIDTKWSDLENMYKLYANEMSTVFKAEKITGALSFLEKLKTLTPHFPQVQNYIDGINNLNNKLRPEIEEMMEKIQSDIDRISREIESEEKYLIELKDKISPYAEKLDEILKGKNSEEIKELTQSFKDENPDFAELEEEKDKQERKISTLKSDKQGRTKLFNRLEDCVGRIESHFAA